MGISKRTVDRPVWLAPLLLALLLLAPAAAGTAAAAGDPGEPVDIAGVVILRVRVPVEGMEPLEQVSRIYRQWVNVLEETKENLSPDLVRIEEVDGVPVIHVGPVPMIWVDEGHARLNQTTPNGLAEVWAANLRRAILRYMEIHGML